MYDAVSQKYGTQSRVLPGLTFPLVNRYAHSEMKKMGLKHSQRRAHKHRPSYGRVDRVCMLNLKKVKIFVRKRLNFGSFPTRPSMAEADTPIQYVSSQRTSF